MKKLSHKILLSSATVAALGGAAAPVIAATANVNIKAVVLSPVTIAATRTLDFASITKASAGTLVVAVDDTPSATGGVTAVAGTPTAGGFKVSATPNFPVSITAPSTVTLAMTTSYTAVATDTDMQVNAFKLALPGPASTVTVPAPLVDSNVAGGSETQYRIGGTLNVAATQRAGAYAGTVTVTANYQ